MDQSKKELYQNDAAQPAGAVEYADSRGARPHKEYPGYDIKPSDGEVSALGNVEHFFIAIIPWFTLSTSDSTW